MATRNELSLEGKLALVTGASRGIGRAIALRLARSGATVAVHYGHKQEDAEGVVGEISEFGGSAFIVSGELGSRSSSSSIVKQLISNQGPSKPRLDVLVCNAGVGGFSTVAEASDDLIDRVIDINLKGNIHLIQSCLPILSPFGRIILVTSGAARRASGPMGLYAATKAGLNSLAIYLAEELGPRGVTCNAIGPGPIVTDASAPFFADEKSKREVIQKTAQKRIGVPDDVSGIVNFLAGAESQWITGQFIEVSGGYRL